MYLFGERCLNLISNTDFRVQKNFIIHGMNPRDFLNLNYMPDTEYRLIDEALTNNPKMFMVLRKLKEQHADKLTNRVILNALNILNKVDYNEAEYFLNQVIESPMSFQLDFSSYALNYQDIVSFAENFRFTIPSFS